MTMSRTTTIRSVIVTFAVALLAGPFIAWQGAEGDQTRQISTLAPHGIVVVGDSITARYNDEPGHAQQGWWSVVGRHFGAEVRTYAQSGSGYLRPGHRCTGNRFIDRFPAFTGDPPSILLVEGGRNDWARCIDGLFVPATDAEVRDAVSAYLDVLQAFLPQTTRIIVLGPPWGPIDPANRERVTAIIAEQARVHGLQFISTGGVLSAERVLDGVHPNRDGSVAIARRVIHALEN